MSALIPLTVLTRDRIWSPERRRDAVLICAAEDECPERLAHWARVVRRTPASPFRGVQVRGVHAAGCVCCTRDPVAMHLAGIYQDRVLGRHVPFREVAVLVGQSEVESVVGSLCDDVLVRARFDVLS